MTERSAEAIAAELTAVELRYLKLACRPEGAAAMTKLLRLGLETRVPYGRARATPLGRAAVGLPTPGEIDG